jgi:hypothetical protein
VATASRAKTVPNVTAEFTLEKETKNMMRFREVDEGRKIGVIYMDKGEHERIGKPDKINVTVTPA